MNMDLDAATKEAPTLTLDPFAEAKAEIVEKKPEELVEEQAVPEMELTPEEQKMVDDFAGQIDLTNTQAVLQYGAGSQKKIADFSETALSNVRTKDMGEVGQLLTDVVAQLKDFDTEEDKGFFGLFKKSGDKLSNLKAKYDKAEVNISKICDAMENHQVVLLKDVAVLDKLYQLNLDDFSRRVNANYRKNGGQHEIIYSMNRDIEQMLSVTAEIADEKQKTLRPIEHMGKGMRSIYMLSLLETYAEDDNPTPGIIMVEEPELFLHPKLQKLSGDLLFRLARKNQVIFSTHSPNLLPNFNSRQIRQVVLDSDGYSTVREHTDISVILNDLGYSANDLMNVDFVFIVEGRQDKSRLPLLLRKYYSEIYDDEGKPSRVAIITTNSCTNIKTYANLKYINQIYLKDSFLMIRDGDGKDADMLKHQLCRYYDERNISDIDHLPRVTEKNVLILKYYSFENYFFNPDVMAKLGVVPSPEAFYDIFYEKWHEYLHRLSSGEKLVAAIGHDLTSPEDVRQHMEDIRIHMRGHNLYDTFYGRYKDSETELLIT